MTALTAAQRTVLEAHADHDCGVYHNRRRSTQDALARKGLIETYRAADPAVRDGVVRYRITDAGRKALS